MMTDLIARAKDGDEEAFRKLVEPHRRELQVHCYRILGSALDAEDAMQEILLAAWQGLRGFEERSSIRTWLYRVATNRCLNALRSVNRRPPTNEPMGEVPDPTRLGEVLWLEPYPDALLGELADNVPDPEARHESREAISLAFITALQLLPPRQRAVLILRDVLGFHAREVAHILGVSDESVTSALKRARATLESRRSSPLARERPPMPNSAVERELIARLTRAFEEGAVDDIVALLTDDVWLTMPPLPLEYQGRALAAQFLTRVAFPNGRTWRVVPTRANGQPAFGVYISEPHTAVLHALGLIVLTLRGEQICAMTAFDKSVLPRFGLPRTFPS